MNTPKFQAATGQRRPERPITLGFHDHFRFEYPVFAEHFVDKTRTVFRVGPEPGRLQLFTGHTVTEAKQLVSTVVGVEHRIFFRQLQNHYGIGGSIEDRTHALFTALQGHLRQFSVRDVLNGTGFVHRAAAVAQHNLARQTDMLFDSVFADHPVITLIATALKVGGGHHFSHPIQVVGVNQTFKVGNFALKVLQPQHHFGFRGPEGLPGFKVAGPAADSRYALCIP